MSQSSVRGIGLTRTASIAQNIPAGWAATGTQAVSLLNRTDNGALAATQVLTVRVGLQMRNTSQLQSLVANGQIVGDSTLSSLYYPTSSQVQSVKSYLTQNGFTSVQAEPNNLIVSGQATAANVQKAFNTTLHSYTQNGKAVFANVSPALVPTSLSGTVIAVLGLSNAPAATTGPKKVAPITPCDLTVPGTNTCVRLTYNPQTYWQTYNVGTVPQAKNVSIAVMAEGNVSGVVSDLRAEENANGLPQVPYSVVQVGLVSPDTSGLDEWDTRYAVVFRHCRNAPASLRLCNDFAYRFRHCARIQPVGIGQRRADRQLVVRRVRSVSVPRRLDAGR